MKLYYTPGACSLSPHIVLREAGFSFELERVDPATKRTETDADYRLVNPKGYVPALRLDDGHVLTEGAAIVQYLADQRPEARLAPPAGTLERARLQEHLNYIASELHKAFSPLFVPGSPDLVRQAAITSVRRGFDWFEAALADERPYLLGSTFTVADVYLFVVASWAVPTGVGLDGWPHLKAFVHRIASREKVKEALRAEGLSS